MYYEERTIFWREWSMDPLHTKQNRNTIRKQLFEQYEINRVENGQLTTSEAAQILINEKTVYAVNQSMNVVHTDLSGNILYGNQNIYKLTLYKPEELLGKNTRIFNAGYHPKEFFKEMWKTILSGKVWRGDVKNRRKDGEIIWVRMIITPLLDEMGNPYQFIALKEDITEKKEMEFKLAQKDKQLSALTNNSYDVVGIVDHTGNIGYLNPAFERLLGFSLNESINSNIESYLDSVELPFEQGILYKLLEYPAVTIRCQTKFKHKDGSHRWCDVAFTNYLDDPHIHGIVFNLRDITKQKEATDKINHLANYDHLTGLPNRRFFENQLKKTLEKATQRNKQVAILSIDLDGFKKVNDTYGHEIGDYLLKMVAHRLSCFFNGKAFIGRLGGDEFAVIIYRFKSLAELNHDTSLLVTSISQPFQVDSHSVQVSASVGISIFPNDGLEMKNLLRKADTAMYKAKKEGKNHHQFFKDMEETISFT